MVAEESEGGDEPLEVAVDVAASSFSFVHLVRFISAMYLIEYL